MSATTVSDTAPSAGARTSASHAPRVLDYEAASLPDDLAEASDEDLHAAAFGIIALSASDERVVFYSALEADRSGLPPSKVLNRKLFDEVAPCMNNFMVAERFRSEERLDAVIDYVFTLRMTPTDVRLRMIRQPGHDRMYLCVDWRG